jgi:hypothetical protein
VGNLVVPVWVVAAVAVAVVLVVVVFTARRIVLSRSRGAFDCSFRRRVDTGEGGWSTGVATYGPGELRWYRMFSLRVRPSRIWRRSEMSIKEFRAPQGGEVYAVLPGAVVVTCTLGSQEMQLAMSSEAYTGFASWIEAAPPGQHAHVT